MRKVELSLIEKEKYEVIKKLVESNGNKKRAQVNALRNPIIFSKIGLMFLNF